MQKIYTSLVALYMTVDDRSNGFFFFESQTNFIPKTNNLSLHARLQGLEEDLPPTKQFPP